MKFGLPFLDHQHGALAGAEAQHLALDHRVGDVQHVDRQLRAAVDVGQAEPLERAQHGVAVAALDDDAESSPPSPSMNSLSRRCSMKRTAAGQRSLDLLALVRVAHRRQDDAVDVAPRRGHRLGQRERRAHVVARAVKLPWTWQARMRSSSITGVRLASESSKPAFTAATIDGRFGRGSSSQICDFIANACAALLHDRRAFAVVLADDDERAAGDAARGEVGERVGGDVDADRST